LFVFALNYGCPLPQNKKRGISTRLGGVQPIALFFAVALVAVFFLFLVYFLIVLNSFFT